MYPRTFPLHLMMLVLLLTTATSAAAQAPERLPTLAERVTPPAEGWQSGGTAGFSAGAVEPQSPGRIVAGAAGGMAVGILGGAAAGALVYVLRGSPDTGDSWIGPGDPWLGALIGAPVGSFAGARLANRGGGDAAVTAAAALLGTAGGLFGSAMLGSAAGSGVIALAVLFGVGAGLPAYAEYQTTGGR